MAIATPGTFHVASAGVDVRVETGEGLARLLGGGGGGGHRRGQQRARAWREGESWVTPGGMGGGQSGRLHACDHIVAKL